MVCELIFSFLSQNTGQKQPMQERIYFKSQFRGLVHHHWGDRVATSSMVAGMCGRDASHGGRQKAEKR